MIKLPIFNPTQNLVWGKPALSKLTIDSLNCKSGRNNQGRIVVKHRSSRLFKSRLRVVSTDLFRLKNEFAQVLRLERDNSRSGFIALLRLLRSGFLCYVQASNTMSLGSFVTINPEKLNFRFFNKLGIKSVALPIFRFSRGSYICNVENNFLSGTRFCRSAGSKAKVQSFSYRSGLASILLPSGQSVFINMASHAFLGSISNAQFYLSSFYKAGQNLREGKRPTVRGVAMNPVDHPHGGGEGKTSGGRPSVTPWGKLTKGARTIAASAKKRKKLLKSKFIHNVK